MGFQVGYPKSINLPVYPKYEQFKYLGTPFMIRIVIVAISDNTLKHTTNLFTIDLPHLTTNPRKYRFLFFHLCFSDRKINQTEKEQE